MYNKSDTRAKLIDPDFAKETKKKIK